MINEKPVLIMQMGVLETDNSWTQLGVYNGKQYELLKSNFVVNLDQNKRPSKKLYRKSTY